MNKPNCSRLSQRLACAGALLLCAAPMAVQGQFGYVTNNGAITISGYTGPGGAVNIPASINGLPVVSIGDNAFQYSSLTSVAIPDSVTSIGFEAFIGSGLNEVAIPDSVRTIGTQAFDYCGSLTQVAIGNGVTNIGDFAFAECVSLTNVTIPGNVTSIGSKAFSACSQLTSVYFSGDAPSDVGVNIFVAETMGGPITDPVTIYYLTNTSGWSNTFSGRPTVMLAGPPQFGTTVDGWKYLSDQVQIAIIIGYAGSNSAGIIPSLINGVPVTGICTAALAHNTSLTSVTIPDSVSSIGDRAFESCYSLTNVTIGSGLTSIGDYVFLGCTNLANVTIPNSVSSIGGRAFAGCYSLTSVTIPDSVTSIGDNAFNSCTSLARVTIPDSVTNIADGAFGLCTNLTNVTIGNDVTSIGDGAFVNCFGLTNVTIGYSVTNIGDLAFGFCYGLTAFAVAAQNPAYSSLNGVLFDKNQSTLLQYPEGKAGSNYTIPNSVTSIGGEAFWGCALTSVTIPDSVTSIGDGAFGFCYGLTAITVAPQNPVYTSLNGVLFNKSLTTLTHFPSGLGGSYAVPNGVTSIGGEAFWGCALTSVTIPNSVTSIGNDAFDQVHDLAGVYFSGNAPSADSSVFFNGSVPATVYYLPGTLGWSSTFAGRPTALWFLPQPLILRNGSGSGVQSNQFGFTISWATNLPVVVEACTNLANPVWQPVQTNTLTSGSVYFSDPQWTNYPARFYRLRSP